MRSGSQTGLRRHNRDLVLRQIVSRRALSRSEIARETGLTGAAVSRIIRELIDAGLLREGPTIELRGRAGRRNVRLELADGGAFVLGVTLTRNARSVSIANARGDIIASAEVGTVELANPADVLRAVARVAGKLIAKTGFDATRLLGCGVSVAGRVDPESGDLQSGNMPGWDGLPLGTMLAERLDLPVRVEARAVALLRAELARGVAADKTNVVLINNGLLLGGAAAIDGRIARGHACLAGQIAHLALPGVATECACGRRGCLDAIASGQAILDQLSDSGAPKLPRDGDPGLHLAKLADWRGDGQDEIGEAFRQAGEHMGQAVDLIISILDPELVLLAGAAGRHPGYLAGVRTVLTGLRGPDAAEQVLASAVTSDQSAIWLGLNSFVYSEELDIEQLNAA